MTYQDKTQAGHCWPRGVTAGGCGGEKQTRDRAGPFSACSLAPPGFAGRTCLTLLVAFHSRTFPEAGMGHGDEDRGGPRPMGHHWGLKLKDWAGVSPQASHPGGHGQVHPASTGKGWQPGAAEGACPPAAFALVSGGRARQVPTAGTRLRLPTAGFRLLLEVPEEQIKERSKSFRNS